MKSEIEELEFTSHGRAKREEDEPLREELAKRARTSGSQ
jgi:hypothetical protein